MMRADKEAEEDAMRAREAYQQALSVGEKLADL